MPAWIALGDSLAVGIGPHLPDCRTEARVGATTAAAAVPVGADHVVVSLGANDSPGMDTEANLRRLRAGLRARSVTWLLPARPPAARAAILAVAHAHGDRMIDTGPFAGPDGLHPGRDGYRALAGMADRAGAHWFVRR